MHVRLSVLINEYSNECEFYKSTLLNNKYLSWILIYIFFSPPPVVHVHYSDILFWCIPDVSCYGIYKYQHKAKQVNSLTLMFSVTSDGSMWLSWWVSQAMSPCDSHNECHKRWVRVTLMMSVTSDEFVWLLWWVSRRMGPGDSHDECHKRWVRVTLMMSVTTDGSVWFSWWVSQFKRWVSVTLTMRSQFKRCVRVTLMLSVTKDGSGWLSWWVSQFKRCVLVPHVECHKGWVWVTLLMSVTSDGSVWLILSVKRDGFLWLSWWV